MIMPWFLTLTQHLRDGWWNWALLATALWAIGMALDLVGTPCLENLGVVGANLKRLIRGLAVYVIGILIGAPITMMIFGGRGWAMDVGFFIAFWLAATAPGVVEGALLCHVLFNKKRK